MVTKVLAKYVGTTTYLGQPKETPDYENNQYYVLIIGNGNGNAVEKQDGSSKVQYGSVRSFTESWTDIKQIKD